MAAHVLTAIDQIINDGSPPQQSHIETALDLSCWTEELDMDDDALFEFIESQNVQIVPAVQGVQLFVVTEDGTGEGIILYLRNVPGGCDSVSPEFKAEFDAAFERFIASIRDAN